MRQHGDILLPEVPQTPKIFKGKVDLGPTSLSYTKWSEPFGRTRFDMSGSVNKVILIGNLGADPEIRSLGEGNGEVASLRIATSERWKDRATGEPREKTERSEEHTSELQSLMRISYAVFCLKKKKIN